MKGEYNNIKCKNCTYFREEKTGQYIHYICKIPFQKEINTNENSCCGLYKEIKTGGM